MIGIDRPLANNDAQVIVTHRRGFGRGPAAFRNAIRADLDRLVKLRVGPAMLEAQRPLESVSKSKATAHRTAQYVLHTHCLAAAHQAAVKDRVENIVLRRIAIGQVEIIRADAFAPAGHRKAEVIARTRRDHQRRRRTGAAAIGFGIDQRTANGNAALRVRCSRRQHLASATIGHTHGGTGNRFAAVERRHPRERAFAAPFEMHRHIRNQRARRHITRDSAPEQRIAKHRACQLDNIESGLGQRNADNFEILARTGQAEFQRIALSVEQGLATRVIDCLGRALWPFLAEIIVIGIVELAQPFGDLPVGPVDFQRRTANRNDTLRQLWLNRADGDRQHPAFLHFDNPKRGCEFHQRWCGVKLDGQRKAFSIFQRAPTGILDPCRDAHCRCHRCWKRPFERQVTNRRIALGIVGNRRRAHRPVREGQSDSLRRFHRNIRRKADLRIAHRIAPGLRIDPRTFPPRGKRLAHREIKALVTRRRPPVRAGNPRIPDQRHFPTRCKRAAALHRDHRRKRFCLVRRTGGHLLRQPCTFHEIAQVPVVQPQSVDNLCHHLGLHHIECNLFADAIDRTIAIGRDGRWRRRDIGRNQKNLSLLDIVAIPPRQHCTRRWSAGINRKRLHPCHSDSARTGQLAPQIDRAADSARQCLFKIKHECLRIDPASR